MKKIILFVSVTALAACSPVVENTTTTNTAATNEVEAVAWTGFEPATYIVTDSKGVKVEVAINGDGTHTVTDPSGKTMSGPFVMKGGKGCFTLKGQAEMCWTNSMPGPDGSWVGTADDGTKATVAKKPD